MQSEREAAKYPFIKASVAFVEGLGLQLDDLADPAYRKIIDRAAERVTEAIIKGETSAKLVDPPTELLSYPIAAMFVSQVGEEFLNRRFALAESVRAYNLLQDEYEDKIIQMAVEEFNWDMKRDPVTIDGVLHTIKLSFPCYLGASSGFHEAQWKLVNRQLTQGYVSLTGTQAARLLQVEVKTFVLERVSMTSKYPLPEPLQSRLDRIRLVFEENRSKLGDRAMPKDVINEAFPPCINYCLEGILSGRRASHMERFGLTSFLVNVGMPTEDMVQLYTSVTDFDEGMTRYQIEHIAGKTGNRTKYTPPTCATLRTHGICRNMDETCRRISHPLSYYRIKAEKLKKEKKKEEAPTA